MSDEAESREVGGPVPGTQAETVPEQPVDSGEIMAVRDLCVKAGLEEAFEKTMYRAFAKHEAAWRAEYPPDDPDILWLEEMRRKFGPVDQDRPGSAG